ncbi:GGDEF domain-containing protein [[Clostridium] colinum]|uniref:GGDEF domain-containing protein n=1 Tax=[Clostridium] colinum TaxID=36835 RepID=UPI00202562DC|nr:GGDEF domain-containing protein [[Clostridium] colinum]
MMISCIIMATALTIIESNVKYFLSIFLVFFTDTVIGIMQRHGFDSIRNINLYIMDNVFIVMFAVGINICFSKLKYKDIKLKNKLLYLSERDSLTNLLNRTAAENFVQKFSTKNNLCTMFILDIDNFKGLNDNLGHIKGDEALIHISLELRKIFRSTDCISRLGGDEFMIFIPELLSKECALKKAKKIMEIFPIKYEYEDGEIEIGCSIGIAFSENNNINLYKKLYKQADQAMYLAKKSGKNQMKVFSIENI